jgi:hypothetical protein
MIMAPPTNAIFEPFEEQQAERSLERFDAIHVARRRIMAIPDEETLRQSLDLQEAGMFQMLEEDWLSSGPP